MLSELIAKLVRTNDESIQITKFTLEESKKIRVMQQGKMQQQFFAQLVSSRMLPSLKATKASIAKNIKTYFAACAEQNNRAELAQILTSIHENKLTGKYSPDKVVTIEYKLDKETIYLQIRKISAQQIRINIVNTGDSALHYHPNKLINNHIKFASSRQFVINGEIDNNESLTKNIAAALSNIKSCKNAHEFYQTIPSILALCGAHEEEISENQYFSKLRDSSKNKPILALVKSFLGNDDYEKFKLEVRLQAVIDLYLDIRAAKEVTENEMTSNYDSPLNPKTIELLLSAIENIQLHLAKMVANKQLDKNEAKAISVELKKITKGVSKYKAEEMDKQLNLSLATTSKLEFNPDFAQKQEKISPFPSKVIAKAQADNSDAVKREKNKIVLPKISYNPNVSISYNLFELVKYIRSLHKNTRVVTIANIALNIEEFLLATPLNSSELFSRDEFPDDLKGVLEAAACIIKEYPQEFWDDKARVSTKQLINKYQLLYLIDKAILEYYDRALQEEYKDNPKELEKAKQKIAGLISITAPFVKDLEEQLAKPEAITADLRFDKRLNFIRSHFKERLKSTRGETIADYYRAIVAAQSEATKKIFIEHKKKVLAEKNNALQAADEPLTIAKKEKELAKSERNNIIEQIKYYDKVIKEYKLSQHKIVENFFDSPDIDSKLNQIDSKIKDAQAKQKELQPYLESAKNKYLEKKNIFLSAQKAFNAAMDAFKEEGEIFNIEQINNVNERELHCLINVTSTPKNPLTSDIKNAQKRLKQQIDMLDEVIEDLQKDNVYKLENLFSTSPKPSQEVEQLLGFIDDDKGRVIANERRSIKNFPREVQFLPPEEKIFIRYTLPLNLNEDKKLEYLSVKHPNRLHPEEDTIDEELSQAYKVSELNTENQVQTEFSQYDNITTTIKNIRTCAQIYSSDSTKITELLEFFTVNHHLFVDKSYNNFFFRELFANHENLHSQIKRSPEFLLSIQDFVLAGIEQRKQNNEILAYVKVYPAIYAMLLEYLKGYEFTNNNVKKDFLHKHKKILDVIKDLVIVKRPQVRETKIQPLLNSPLINANEQSDLELYKLYIATNDINSTNDINEANLELILESLLNTAYMRTLDEYNTEILVKRSQTFVAKQMPLISEYMSDQNNSTIVNTVLKSIINKLDLQDKVQYPINYRYSFPALFITAKDKQEEIKFHLALGIVSESTNFETINLPEDVKRELAFYFKSIPQDQKCQEQFTSKQVTYKFNLDGIDYVYKKGKITGLFREFIVDDQKDTYQLQTGRSPRVPIILHDDKFVWEKISSIDLDSSYSKITSNGSSSSKSKSNSDGAIILEDKLDPANSLYVTSNQLICGLALNIDGKLKTTDKKYFTTKDFYGLESFVGIDNYGNNVLVCQESNRFVFTLIGTGIKLKSKQVKNSNDLRLCLEGRENFQLMNNSYYPVPGFNHSLHFQSQTTIAEDKVKLENLLLLRVLPEANHSKIIKQLEMFSLPKFYSYDLIDNKLKASSAQSALYLFFLNLQLKNYSLAKQAFEQLNNNPLSGSSNELHFLIEALKLDDANPQALALKMQAAAILSEFHQSNQVVISDIPQHAVPSKVKFIEKNIQKDLYNYLEKDLTDDLEKCYHLYHKQRNNIKSKWKLDDINELIILRQLCRDDVKPKNIEFASRYLELEHAQSSFELAKTEQGQNLLTTNYIKRQEQELKANLNKTVESRIGVSYQQLAIQPDGVSKEATCWQASLPKIEVEQTKSEEILSNKIASKMEEKLGTDIPFIGSAIKQGARLAVDKAIRKLAKDDEITSIGTLNTNVHPNAELDVAEKTKLNDFVLKIQERCSKWQTNGIEAEFLQSHGILRKLQAIDSSENFLCLYNYLQQKQATEKEKLQIEQSLINIIRYIHSYKYYNGLRLPAGINKGTTNWYWILLGVLKRPEEFKAINHKNYINNTKGDFIKNPEISSLNLNANHRTYPDKVHKNNCKSYAEAEKEYARELIATQKAILRTKLRVEQDIEDKAYNPKESYPDKKSKNAAIAVNKKLLQAYKAKLENVLQDGASQTEINFAIIQSNLKRIPKSDVFNLQNIQDDLLNKAIKLVEDAQRQERIFEIDLIILKVHMGEAWKEKQTEVFHGKIFTSQCEATMKRVVAEEYNLSEKYVTFAKANNTPIVSNTVLPEPAVDIIEEIPDNFVYEYFAQNYPEILAKLNDFTVPDITADNFITASDNDSDLFKAKVKAANDDYKEGVKYNLLQKHKKQIASANLNDNVIEKCHIDLTKIATTNTDKLQLIKEKLLEFANSKFAKDVQEASKKRARAEDKITIARLMTLFLRNNIYEYQATTHLSESEVKQLHTSIYEYLHLRTNLNHIKRALAEISDFNKHKHELSKSSVATKLYEVAKVLTTKRAFASNEKPVHLVFENCENITIREEQAEMLDSLLAKDENGKYIDTIIQLIMGGGKSKIISPILAILAADGDKLVIFDVPEPLLQTNFADIRQTVSDNFGIKCHKLYFSRYGNASSKYLANLYTSMQSWRANKEIIVTSGNCIQNLELKYIELLKARQDLLQEQKEIEFSLTTEFTKKIEELDKQILYMRKINDLIYYKGNIICDEVDLRLNRKHALVYAAGKEKWISQSVPGIDVVANVANFYNFFLTEDENKKITIDGKEYTFYDLITQQAPVAKGKNWIIIAEQLADILISGNFSSPLGTLLEVISSKEESEQLRLKANLKIFLTNFSKNGFIPKDDANKLQHDFNELYSLIDDNPQAQEAISLYRFYLSDLFETTLPKRHNFDYGPAKQAEPEYPERQFLAVPYSGVDTPKLNSKYNLEETCVLTMQSLLQPQTEIPEWLFSKFMRGLFDAAEAELEMLKIRYSTVDQTIDDTEIAKEFNFLKLGSKKLSFFEYSEQDERIVAANYEKAYQELKDNPLFRTFLARKSILPKITCDDATIKSDPYTYVEQLNSQTASFRGYTGTPDAPQYHNRLHDDTHATIGTDGRTINHLISKNTKVIMAKSDDKNFTVSEFLDEVFSDAKTASEQAKIRAIIDNGIFKDFSNHDVAIEVAKYIKDKNPKIEWVLYYNDSDKLCALNVENPGYIEQIGTSDRKVIAERLKLYDQNENIEFDKCFTIYDQKRTTGCDIKQAPDTVAPETLTNLTTIRDVLQATMRLRDFSNDQTVVFYITKKLQQLFPNREKWDLNDILQFASNNEIRSKLDNYYLGTIEQIDAIIRKDLMLMISETGFNDINLEQELFDLAEHYFIRPEEFSSKRKYGSVDYFDDTKQVLENKLALALENYKLVLAKAYLLVNNKNQYQEIVENHAYISGAVKISPTDKDLLAKVQELKDILTETKDKVAKEQKFIGMQDKLQKLVAMRVQICEETVKTSVQVADMGRELEMQLEIELEQEKEKEKEQAKIIAIKDEHLLYRTDLPIQLTVERFKTLRLKSGEVLESIDGNIQPLITLQEVADKYLFTDNDVKSGAKFNFTKNVLISKHAYTVCSFAGKNHGAFDEYTKHIQILFRYDPKSGQINAMLVSSKEAEEFTKLIANDDNADGAVFWLETLNNFKQARHNDYYKPNPSRNNLSLAKLLADKTTPEYYNYYSIIQQAAFFTSDWRTLARGIEPKSELFFLEEEMRNKVKFLQQKVNEASLQNLELKRFCKTLKQHDNYKDNLKKSRKPLIFFDLESLQSRQGILFLEYMALNPLVAKSVDIKILCEQETGYADKSREILQTYNRKIIGNTTELSFDNIDFVEHSHEAGRKIQEIIDDYASDDNANYKGEAKLFVTNKGIENQKGSNCLCLQTKVDAKAKQAKLPHDVKAIHFALDFAKSCHSFPYSYKNYFNALLEDKANYAKTDSIENYLFTDLSDKYKNGVKGIGRWILPIRSSRNKQIKFIERVGDILNSINLNDDFITDDFSLTIAKETLLASYLFVCNDIDYEKNYRKQQVLKDLLKDKLQQLGIDPDAISYDDYKKYQRSFDKFFNLFATNDKVIKNYLANTHKKQKLNKERLFALAKTYAQRQKHSVFSANYKLLKLIDKYPMLLRQQNEDGQGLLTFAVGNKALIEHLILRGYQLREGEYNTKFLEKLSPWLSKEIEIKYKEDGKSKTKMGVSFTLLAALVDNHMTPKEIRLHKADNPKLKNDFISKVCAVKGLDAKQEEFINDIHKKHRFRRLLAYSLGIVIGIVAFAALLIATFVLTGGLSVIPSAIFGVSLSYGAKSLAVTALSAITSFIFGFSVGSAIYRVSRWPISSGAKKSSLLATVRDIKDSHINKQQIKIRNYLQEKELPFGQHELDEVIKDATPKGITPEKATVMRKKVVKNVKLDSLNSNLKDLSDKEGSDNPDNTKDKRQNAATSKQNKKLLENAIKRSR